MTGTAKAVAALGEALGADFTDEGDRYRHRDALTGLFTVWFTGHTADEVAAALSATSILWERYRDLRRGRDRSEGDRQPAVHDPGSAANRRVPGAGAAPVDRRQRIPRRWPHPRSATTPPTCLRELGLPPIELDRLFESGTVA